MTNTTELYDDLISAGLEATIGDDGIVSVADPDPLKSLGISLQLSVHRRIRAIAKSREQSVSSLIRLAVKEWLERNGY